HFSRKLTAFCIILVVRRLQISIIASADRRLPVRVHKSRYLVVPAFLLLLVAAWPSTAAAQRRFAGGRRTLVFRGGFYGPVFFDPWYSYGYPFYQYGSPYGPYGYPYG